MNLVENFRGWGKKHPGQTFHQFSSSLNLTEGLCLCKVTDIFSNLKELFCTWERFRHLRSNFFGMWQRLFSIFKEFSNTKYRIIVVFECIQKMNRNILLSCGAHFRTPCLRFRGSSRILKKNAKKKGGGFVFFCRILTPGLEWMDFIPKSFQRSVRIRAFVSFCFRI